MIRITAKRLLMGRLFPVCALLIVSFCISAFGLIAAFLIPLYLLSDNAEKEILNRFGDFPYALKIALCIGFALLGLFIFSMGRNLKVKTVCSIISDKRTVFSIKKSFQFLLLYTVKNLFALCWGFVYFLPCAVCTAFLVMSLSQGAMEKNIYYSWVTGCIVLFLLAVFFTFVTLQRYSAWQLYLCSEGGSVISSLYKSLAKTKNRCLKIAVFKLSMTGWIVSCVLILPIIYVLPYYNLSSALCVLDAIGFQAEKKREEIPPAVFRVIRN